MKESLIWILLGIVTIVFGVIVLGNTFAASVAIAWLTGILLLVSGVMEVIGGFRVEGVWAKIFAFVMGALMVFLGWSFMSHPLEGVISLSLLILILLIAGGIARIVFAFRMSGTSFFWPMILSGVLSLVLAAIVWGNPAATVNLLGILLGVEMLSNGFSMVFLGFFAKQEEAA